MFTSTSVKTVSKKWLEVAGECSFAGNAANLRCKAFHALGPATPNDLSVRYRRVLGTVKFPRVLLVLLMHLLQNILHLTREHLAKIAPRIVARNCKKSWRSRIVCVTIA